MTTPPAGPIVSRMIERLSSLDGSFLRVETGSAHMHVAWSATFRVAAGRPAPTLARLRASVDARLRHTPRFRRRLAWPPPGLGEPFWVDDPDFRIDRHIGLLGRPGEALDDARFDALCDRALSEPLDRTRPLWRIYLAPRLEGGRCGLVAKLHHALVDGKSAVEVALLLFDAAPDAPPERPRDWCPSPPPSRTRLALTAIGAGAGESLRTARGVARLAGHPVNGGARVVGTLRRASLAVGDDLGAGATLNDVCLALVAGALRELALARGERPAPLKAMVPVNLRGEAEGAALGNRISLVFIDLPLQLSTARARLERVRRDTAAFKSSGRADGAHAVLAALGLLPVPLRGAAARAVGSPRVYNLTVSNIPGPRFPLYMLGAELIDAYPVVPIADGHALSVGVFTHGEQVYFGLYADPDALPQVRDVPAALNASLLALGRAYATHRSGAPRTGRARRGEPVRTVVAPSA
jgi:hypothetical protein